LRMRKFDWMTLAISTPTFSSAVVRRRLAPSASADRGTGTVIFASHARVQGVGVYAQRGT
jgi:hypothetical protein